MRLTAEEEVAVVAVLLEEEDEEDIAAVAAAAEAEARIEEDVTLVIEIEGEEEAAIEDPATVVMTVPRAEREMARETGNALRAQRKSLLKTRTRRKADQAAMTNTLTSLTIRSISYRIFSSDK